MMHNHRNGIENSNEIQYLKTEIHNSIEKNVDVAINMDMEQSDKSESQKSVSVLRNHFENCANRKINSALSEAKIHQMGAKRNKKATPSVVEEIVKIKTENEAMSARINDLEQLIENQAHLNVENEIEIRRLRDEMASNLQYSLRSNVASPAGRTVSSGKRKRTECDENGNECDEEIDTMLEISQLKRLRTNGNDRPLALHQSVIFEPKGTITVLSVGTKNDAISADISGENVVRKNRARKIVCPRAPSSKNIEKNGNNMCTMM